MATINTRVILSGQGVTTDTLSVDLTTIMTVESPTVQSGALDVPATGADITIPGFPGTAEQDKVQILYLKNTDSTTLEFIVSATHDGAGTKSIFATLGPGEWLCAPISATTEIDLEGVTNATTCEYGFWALTP